MTWPGRARGAVAGGLALASALGLSLSLSLPAIAAPAAPAVLGGDSRITMTIDNWGDDVSITDSTRVAWAHPGSADGATTVTVHVSTGGTRWLGFSASMSAPDAPIAPWHQVCADETHIYDTAVECVFQVPISVGGNELDFSIAALNIGEKMTSRGSIRGGELSVVPLTEVRDAAGAWHPLPRGGEIAIDGASTAALRYRLLNTGSIPFRSPDGCGGTVYPDQQIVCMVRSPRPGYALVGPYSLPVGLLDAANGTKTVNIEARISASGLTIVSHERARGTASDRRSADTSLPSDVYSGHAFGGFTTP